MGNLFADNPTWSIGILVGLFGIIAAHRLVSYREKRNNFNNAAKVFTNVFHGELKEIYPIPANWPNNIDHYLRERFDNLSEAVGEFRDHLPHRKQKAFADAWFRFYCCTGREVDKACQCYHHYMPFSGVSVVDGKEGHEDNTKTYKEDFKKNVEALLKFARQK
jgi:hypothetical protein